MKVIKEIRDGLMLLSPEDLMIKEATDSAHIEQQLANKAWNWSSCKHIAWSVSNLIIRLNLEHTEETMTLWNDDIGHALRMARPQNQPHALKNALKFLTDRVNLARIDTANEK